MRQHDPVATVRDNRAVGSADLDGHALGHRVRLVAEPGPELLPARLVVGRGHAERGAVIELWWEAKDAHEHR